MKKIPGKVKTLLRASNQVNSLRKAVEELVYNAIDAGATSIAIRINVQENTIQVIDNGCGISSKDFKFIGHKYMTSKFTDLSTLKSAPNNYGFRGQSISNLINISKSVKVVSRHEKSEETWWKLFEHAKEKEIKQCNARPSKGTTVEITGFLYNLNIQKKSKDILSDLQSIKTLLEHLSLVHCNISMSLRDDSKDEIIFKMHKNRDVCQTLSTLYNINKKDLQELQVEKNEYKVTAYMGKTENNAGKHFIYLNGKFISSFSKLHKSINNHFSSRFKTRGIHKSKMKNKNTEEEKHIQKHIPDYFVFIKCPYLDYDLSNSPKQSILEFKDWNQINKLLEKLIKFFNGDMKLKEIDINVNKEIHTEQNSGTRERVKKIIEKILGTTSKEPGISNMRNGIRGKQVKRKSNKLLVMPKRKYHKNYDNHGNRSSKDNKELDEYAYNLNKNPNNIEQNNNGKHEKINKKKFLNANNSTKSYLNRNVNKNYKNINQRVSDKNKSRISSNFPVIQLKNKAIDKRNKSSLKPNAIEKLTRKITTISVEKKCDKLVKTTKQFLDKIPKEAFHMSRKEKTQNNNTAKSNINVPMGKEIDEIVINGINLRNCNRKEILASEREICDGVKEKQVYSNYDLLQTILKSQQESYVLAQNLATEINTMAKNMFTPKLANVSERQASQPINVDIESNTEQLVTYKSHNYHSHQSIHSEYNASYHSHLQIQKENQFNWIKQRRTFITKQSRDNLALTNDRLKSNFKKKHAKGGVSKQLQSHIRNLFKQTSNLFNLKKQIMGATCESSYTIEFTESNIYELNRSKSNIIPGLSKSTRMSIEEIRSQIINNKFAAEDKDRISINSATYVLTKVDKNGYTINEDDYWPFNGTYTIEKTNNGVSSDTSSQDHDHIDDEIRNDKNFIFVSNTQKSDHHEQHILDPMSVCETILNSEEVINREFEKSFSNRNNQLPEALVSEPNEIAHYQNSSYIEPVYEKENEVIDGVIKNLYRNIDIIGKDSEISHHFISNDRNVNKNLDSTSSYPKLKNKSSILDSKQSKNVVRIHSESQEKHVSQNVLDSNFEDFHFNNRLGFVPKGLSPIFQNCQTKNICEYNLSRDYYEKEMYKDFADDVRYNAEIFEPKIQAVKESTTKALNKVNTKISKDNSDLKFDGHSLENAKVLGQVDTKFIAAIVKEGCTNDAAADFLILFDQHAVHERIRLENNLENYVNKNQWKPVIIDAVSLKLTKDDVLYLHNHKDKFEQLGLQWNLTNSEEISVTAIPEAVLGQNPRQVEKIINALRRLITEEINTIKMQGGCVSLYPKSIMDLVFSEACSYAIKFGDTLSKSDCMELLKSLSACKTPFQCAHGRPVMAVIVENKQIAPKYKINLNKVIQWKSLLRH